MTKLVQTVKLIENSERTPANCDPTRKMIMARCYLNVIFMKLDFYELT